MHFNLFIGDGMHILHCPCQNNLCELVFFFPQCGFWELDSGYVLW